MKVAIHHSKGSYSQGCIDYMQEKNIDYKIVNAYATTIVEDVRDCDAFFWHHHHSNPKDVLHANNLLNSLHAAGKRVYPNPSSSWHFDNKVAQKYLLEALGLPLVKSYAFYSKQDALDWISTTSFPIVHKLKGGASSYNVSLVHSLSEAEKLINRAFGKGFRAFDPIKVAKEDIRKLRKGEGSLKALLSSILHLWMPYQIERSQGREKGYFYFQEFIPDCDHDIRIQFIGDKCYAMKRNVRENDFRASGANMIEYDGSKLPIESIKLGFEIAEVLNMQTLALDLIPVGDTWQIGEISYAFGIDEGECDFGYYSKDLKWHPGPFNPYQFMIEDLIK